MCFFLSVSIPAAFVAAVTYHKELLPTSLAITVTQLRGGVPFPAFVECILLIFVFEILKETGVRMPQSLGHALSIVGGLVVGQAAVEDKNHKRAHAYNSGAFGNFGTYDTETQKRGILLQNNFCCLAALFRALRVYRRFYAYGYSYFGAFFPRGQLYGVAGCCRPPHSEGYALAHLLAEYEDTAAFLP